MKPDYCCPMIKNAGKWEPKECRIWLCNQMNKNCADVESQICEALKRGYKIGYEKGYKDCEWRNDYLKYGD